MALLIRPYLDGTSNAGYDIVSAIRTADTVDGFAVYAVLGIAQDNSGDAVTWMAHLYHNEKDEPGVYKATFYWGHYFRNYPMTHYDEMSAERRAQYDMVKRAGLSWQNLRDSKPEL